MMVCVICKIVPGEPGRKTEPLKMAATSTKSIAEEIIDAIKDKTYDSCVSNVTGATLFAFHLVVLL